MSRWGCGCLFLFRWRVSRCSTHSLLEEGLRSDLRAELTEEDRREAEGALYVRMGRAYASGFDEVGEDSE